MAITSILKANPLPSLKQRQSSFEVNLRCIKPFYFWPSSLFGSVKVKSLSITNIITTSTSTNQKCTANPPPKLKAPQFVNPSVSQDDPAINAVQKTLKWLRIAALVVALSLLLVLIMYSRQSALASSVGVMGGRSFPSTAASNCPTSNSLLGLSFIYFIRCSLGNPSMLETYIYLMGMVVLFVAGRIKDLMLRETIMKLQVCLYVSGQSLRKDLNRIAKTTDVSNSDGWKSILKETTNSLLRYKKHWISGYSSLNMKRSCEDAEKYFEKLSSKEHRKYGVETLINLDDMERESIINQEANQCTNTYMVVTIFVAATLMLFIPDLPTITDRGDVEEAVKVLQFVSEKSEIQGVNVFWTPQKENDILSLEDVQRNYLHLRRFSDPTEFNLRRVSDPTEYN